MFRGAPFCFTARTTDNPHHVVAHGESVAEIKMKGDTTPKKRWEFWFCCNMDGEVVGTHWLCTNENAI